MFRLLRLLFWTAVLVGLAYFILAVPLGQRTLFGHFLNIWRSPQGQELRQGARQAAEPAIEKMKRGVRELHADGGTAPSK